VRGFGDDRDRPSHLGPSWARCATSSTTAAANRSGSRRLDTGVLSRWLKPMGCLARRETAVGRPEGVVGAVLLVHLDAAPHSGLCALQQSRFFQFREDFYVFHRYPSIAPRHCRSSVDQCSVNTVPFTWALSLSSSQHPGGEESDRQERDHEPEGIEEPERLGQQADHGWAAEVC
jgi:hypothetical protein